MLNIIIPSYKNKKLLKKCIKYIHASSYQDYKIIVVDDLLATGGTAEAGCKLIEEAGGEIVKILFLVELPELEGRKKLNTYDIDSIISFEGH